MTKAAKAKTLAKNYVVPQSRDQVDTMIRELGETRRRVARIEADMNDRLAKMKEKFEQKAEADRQRATELLSGIEDWCSVNRDQITEGGKVKHAHFKNGDVNWRFRPPTVHPRGKDAIIENLKSLGLTRFIRVKEEINKEAMLNEPDIARGIAGITIRTAGEDFNVVPFEQELSEAAQCTSSR